MTRGGMKCPKECAAASYRAVQMAKSTWGGLCVGGVGEVGSPDDEAGLGFERTEVKQGVEPDARDDPITYQKLTK